LLIQAVATKILKEHTGIPQEPVKVPERELPDVKGLKFKKPTLMSTLDNSEL